MQYINCILTLSERKFAYGLATRYLGANQAVSTFTLVQRAPRNLWVVCLSSESSKSNEVLNKLSLHGEGLKNQNIASLLEEQARTKACARGREQRGYYYGILFLRLTAATKYCRTTLLEGGVLLAVPKFIRELGRVSNPSRKIKLTTVIAEDFPVEVDGVYSWCLQAGEFEYLTFAGLVSRFHN